MTSLNVTLLTTQQRHRHRVQRSPSGGPRPEPATQLPSECVPVPVMQLSLTGSRSSPEAVERSRKRCGPSTHARRLSASPCGRSPRSRTPSPPSSSGHMIVASMRRRAAQRRHQPQRCGVNGRFKEFAFLISRLGFRAPTTAFDGRLPDLLAVSPRAPSSSSVASMLGAQLPRLPVSGPAAHQRADPQLLGSPWRRSPRLKCGHSQKGRTACRRIASCSVIGAAIGDRCLGLPGGRARQKRRVRVRRWPPPWLVRSWARSNLIRVACRLCSCVWVRRLCG